MVDDLKNSAQVWGGDVTGESPPAYSAPEEEEVSPQGDTPFSAPVTAVAQRRPASRAAYDPLKRLSALATIPYQKYNIADGVLSPDKLSLTLKHSDLYSQPQHLLSFVLEQAYLPPKPTLRIVGSHSERDVDFDITLSLTHLLNLKKHKWKFTSAQFSPIQGGSQVVYDRNDNKVMTMLASSIKQFCKDRSENKSYTLTRAVEGLPTEMLEGQVRNLAASVKYCGQLRIDFTSERSKIVVHKQPSSWFSNVLRLHPEKQFEMAETVWDLSDPSSEEENHNSADVGLRACHEWWQSWTTTIRNAMITKHRGNLGIDDWIEARMGRIEPDRRLWCREHQIL